MQPKITMVLEAAVALILVTVSGCVAPSQPATPTLSAPTGVGDRPNIIVIVTDDQRYDTLEYIPQIKSLIFDRGVTFTKAYVTTPLCCPSRSSILTGMYAHSHGVINNETDLQRATFASRLHENGYNTGFVGKYLNSWSGTLRPEFDFWVGSPLHDYVNPRLNINGEWQNFEGYQTNILAEYANQFIEQAEQQDKPWLLYYAPHAPHGPALPDPVYKDLYADLPPYRPVSFNEADISDKPFRDTLPLMSKREINHVDFLRLQQLRALKSVDNSVAALIQTLENNGTLDNTAVFFMSDNGLLLGEHRLGRTKFYAYEPSIRVPFGFYYAPIMASPLVIDKLVANIDVAPTIYELAGIPIPDEVEGLSLLSLLHDPTMWRDSLLIESWPTQTSEGGDATRIGLDVAYVAVHTGQYIYIETVGGTPEFYDLVADPDQMESQVDNPDYADVIQDLRARLDFMKGPYVTTLATQQALPTPTASP